MARGSSSRSRRSRSSRRPVLVVGAYGQDGTILCRQLEAEGRRVLRLGRGKGVSVLDREAVARLVRRERPAEAYYLAAAHTSAEGAQAEHGAAFERAFAVHVRGLWHVLAALEAYAPDARLVYASSSRVFAAAGGKALNEESEIDPCDDYGVTKALGMFVCRYFRERRGLRASTAILFNHESGLRRPEFLTRRIFDQLLAIKRTGKGRLVLGDPAARVDWLWAPDAVRAMRLIAAARKPGDFVVASGRTHSVREFAAEAARALGLPAAAGRAQAAARGPLRRGVAARGDARKLRRVTGWRPSVDFAGMVRAVARELEQRGGRA